MTTYDNRLSAIASYLQLALPNAPNIPRLPTFRAASKVKIPATNKIIQSAQRIVKGKTSRGIQALSKKTGRGDAAFSGLKANSEAVTKTVKSVMNSKHKIINVTRNQQGVEVIDVFNKQTNQGVRLIKETGEFDTFINLNN